MEPAGTLGSVDWYFYVEWVSERRLGQAGGRKSKPGKEKYVFTLSWSLLQSSLCYPGPKVSCWFPQPQSQARREDSSEDNCPCESLRFAQETHIGMGCPRCLSISYIGRPRKVICGAKQRGTIIKTASELQKNLLGECKRGVRSPTKRLGAITAAAMPVGQGLYPNVRHCTPCRVIVAVFCRL